MKTIKKIVNKSPHAINILDKDNKIIKVIKRSGEIARILQETTVIGHVDDIPISSTAGLKLRNIPEPEHGVYYIVSQLIKSAMPDRPDLLVPRGLVKSADGNILGCKTLDLGEIKLNQ